MPLREESEANALGNVHSSEDTAMAPGVPVNMSSCRAVPEVRCLAALLLFMVCFIPCLP